MIVLVAYDIGDNDARARLSDFLQSKGLSRIQRSVFVGRVLPATLKDLERALPKYARGSSDAIHLVPLLEYSLRYMRAFGGGASLPAARPRVVV